MRPDTTHGESIAEQLTDLSQTLNTLYADAVSDGRDEAATAYGEAARHAVLASIAAMRADLADTFGAAL